MAEPTCRYCETAHDERYLCDPAKRFLDAVVERGESLTMPDVEFTAPVDSLELGLGLNPAAGDRLLRQLVISAATIPHSAIGHVPAVMLGGQDAYGRPLPRWLYAGPRSELRRARDLLDRMVSLAVRTARTQNEREGHR